MNNPEQFQSKPNAANSDIYGYDALQDMLAQNQAANETIATATFRPILEHVLEKPKEAQGRTLENTSEEFQHVVHESYSDTQSIFTKLFKVPKLSRLASSQLESVGDPIDWQQLEKMYTVCTQIGMEPTLVIAPHGRDLAAWTKFYMGVRPKALGGPFLQGLTVHDITMHLWWQNIVKGQPANLWRTMIIASEINPPIDSEPFHTHWFDEAETDGVNKLSHPTVEGYLALQALRVYRGEDPLDYGYGTYTWLSQSFTYQGVAFGYAGGTDRSTDRVVIHDAMDSLKLGVRPTYIA